MKPIYLSYFLNEETPVYGGAEKAFIQQLTSTIANGDTSNNSKFTFPGHIGTHIDFPYHFNDNGKKCSDYPASFWIFKKVGYLECSISEVPFRILDLSNEIELLILKTGFGSKRSENVYWSSQPVIPAFFAQLFKKNFPLLRVFGFDLISLTSKQDRQEGKKAHLQFLIEHGILVLEDMNIDQLKESPETVIILPLQVSKADGVPCTVIAF